VADSGREDLLTGPPSVVTQPCTVIVAAADLLPALKRRADPSTEILTFGDGDALRALETITRRRPRVVALERQFAATPRGTALVNRIKADPGLTQSEIRLIAHDTSAFVTVPRTAADTARAVAATRPQELDQRGTRRAPRFKVAPSAEVVVDGKPATLVDLSTVGAQVVSVSVLRPNQKVRMVLDDPGGPGGGVRLTATVAWASFEADPKGGPRYRAGVDFLDAVADDVAAYCLRHKA
jgi:hypothetical protein